ISPDRHDDEPPTITDYQDGDDTWRKDNTTAYNVDFNDTGGSKLSKFQAKVYTEQNQGGTVLDDWRDVEVGINSNEYTTNWSLPSATWNNMQQGYNYVSIKAFDGTGNTAEKIDAFYVKKDTGIPSIGNNEAGGDNIWRKQAGEEYDVDFSDSLSLLDNAQYSVYSSTNMQGTQLIDWTNIFDNLNQANYVTNWQVQFSSLTSGYNYVSVQVFDNAGNVKQTKDAFYIKKDTISPTVEDYQEGDDQWQKSAGKTYDVDFKDIHSLLDDAQYRVCTSTNGVNEIIPWTNIFINLSSETYTADWGLGAGNWDLLLEGATNWVSVRCFDVVSNTTTVNDIFYILKDTTPPTIDNKEAGGDDTWRTSAGTKYDIDFYDYSSLLSTASYAVYSSTGKGGDLVINWTEIFSSTGTGSYTIDWEVDFSSLSAGYNYVTVRCYDVAGNIKETVDAFYIKKSTEVPVITNNQTGDDTWRRVNTAEYDVDFQWGGTALLDYFQTKITSGPNGTGAVIDDWRVVISTINDSFYALPWSLKDETWNVLWSSRNWVSVSVYDAAGISTTLLGAFYVMKDTSPPDINNYEEGGDDTWRTTAGTTYNVDFTDNLSLLDRAEYTIWNSTGQTGTQLVYWTSLSTYHPVNLSTYDTDWEVAFSSCVEGFNYISVRAWDIAGSTRVIPDAFFIKKDTTPPIITDNQTGDDIWRTTGGTSYNVDFKDTGSLLNYAQYRVCTSTNGAGEIISWTDIFSGLNQEDYTDNWQVDFSSLTQGYNYVSVRIADYAGLTAESTDVFYIKKDTSPPSVVNYQTGDDIWRNGPGTAYNVDFEDTGSLLYSAEYCVYSSTGRQGTQVLDWTVIATNISSSTYTDNWTVSFDNLSEGFNYISVRVKDNALNEFIDDDVFYIKKDTTTPVMANYEAGGDDTWRKSPGTLYNIDFQDSGGSLLNYAQYKVCSSTGQVGTIIDWTDILGVSGDSFTDDWQIDYANCQQGYNYISVRIYDHAGNVKSEDDAFYVKKDNVYPSITDNQAGDDSWRNGPGSTYDVDFNDDTSLLQDAEYIIWSAQNQTGTKIKDWTAIFTSTNVSSYTSDWEIDFSTCPEGISYVSVRVNDNALNSSSLNDVFYIKKDTTPPTIDDQQTGDDTWRSSNSGFYNINFNDTGGSKLFKFQTKVSTGPNETGILVQDWTDVVININADSYTTDWQILNTTFDLMKPATNYVSVRVWDIAGSSATLNDVFYVKKDTSVPSVVDNQAGDDTWRKEPGTAYDVDFEDYESNLSTASYIVYSGPNKTGTLLKDWTNIFSNLNQPSYTTDWTVDFASLKEGYNYVSVIVWDMIGNYAETVDAFYVKKDTTPPAYTNTEAGGDDTWRKTGRAYDVDFQDSASLLSDAKYTVWTGPGRTGTERKVLTSIPGVGGSSYTTDWTIDFNSLQDSTTNYVSIEIYDVAGNTTTLNDAFYVKKDTSSPIITDNQSGDDSWRNASGTVYDIDFEDSGSGLSGAEYTIWTNTGQTGVQKKAWTPITGVSGSSFTGDWTVDFDSCQEGYNYVSVRCWDNLSSTTTLNDVFYVKKDTTSPTIDDQQSGDDTVYTSDPGPIFDVNFNDSGNSLLDYAQYVVWTGPNQTGTQLKSWTNVFTSTNVASYTADWGVDFGALLQTPTTNYVSVRVYDNAGNAGSLNDVFYVKKSTPTPVVTDNQDGDDIWRRVSGTTYNVDFASNSVTASLDYFQTKICSEPNEGGVVYEDWTIIQSAIGAPTYTTDWEIHFASCVEGNNYVSVRVYDTEGHNTKVQDVFYVKKDTTPPSIDDQQSGDNSWRNSAGTVYNIDFKDAPSGSLLNSAQYIVKSPTGAIIIDWTEITPSVAGQADYTTDWQVNFNSLWEDTTNWVSVRTTDYAGNSAESTDVFYIKKDTSAPSVVNYEAGGDDTWQISAGRAYNVDFQDSGGSLLNYAQYKVCSSTDQVGTIIDWTDIATNISNPSYTTDWEVAFSSLIPGFNYVSVRTADYAGNSAESVDVFYIKKDTSAPSVVDYQAGDETWRDAEGTLYNVDFQDTGSSKLDKAYYIVYSSPNFQETLIQDWTEIFSNLNQDEYTSDWEINFLNAQEGYNYVSVRCWDFAASSTTIADVFYLKKDTLPPQVKDYQSGDDIWRSQSGTTYNVDFEDAGSLLDSIEYTVWTSPARSGTEVKPWTMIADTINASGYTPDWEVDFNGLNNGTNYVSVRAYDNLGKSVIQDDVFYIRKDVVEPTITNNQSGDDTWQKTDPGAIYDIDFADALSLLDYAQYSVYSSTYITGIPIVGWTQIFSSTGTPSYTDDWSIDFAQLPSGYNYVMARVRDHAGNMKTQSNYLFYVKKDTEAPSVTDYQSGDEIWRKTGGTTYNVDFGDDKSLLDYVQYKVTSSTGGLIIDWTDIAANINSSSYTLDWEVTPFDSLKSSYNYVSVRAFDNLGNNRESSNVFFIKKDTSIPSIIDYQSGDDTWRAQAGTTYDVDFEDDLSGLNSAQYIIYPSSGMQGTPLSDWTDISGVSGNSFTTDWQINFTLCQQGTSWISVRVYDVVGSSNSMTDAFYVRKDITVPTYTDNQLGDDEWRSQPGTTYDVDFADTGGSLLDYSQYKVYDGTNPVTSNVVIDWTDIATNINASGYTTDWEVNFDNLLNEAYNY
ncbi:MAG: hypothetical protein DRP74_07035, partial [Candidatus Omnitrophota bacterium]